MPKQSRICFALLSVSVLLCAVAGHAHPPAYSITIGAYPVNVCNYSTITVHVSTNYIPEAGRHIHFSADPAAGVTFKVGSNVVTEVNTNAAGNAVVTFYPGSWVGTIQVIAKDQTFCNEHQSLCAQYPDINKAQVAVYPFYPTAPVVTDDGDYTQSMTSLHATWTPGDQMEYKFAIGTTEGGTDIVNWKSSGANAYATEPGLSLHAGIVYYFSVKYKTANNCWSWSNVGYSDGISVPSDSVVYVVPGGTGDKSGSTWSNAMASVQAALNLAFLTGKEVWVAAGTYNEHITLRNGVGLYGGFECSEWLRDQRNWKDHVTILDGGG